MAIHPACANAISAGFLSSASSTADTALTESPRFEDVRRDAVERCLDTFCPGLVAADGHDERNVHALETAGGESDPAQRRLIRQMEVVDEQEQWTPERKIRHQPIDTEQRGLTRIRGG